MMEKVNLSEGPFDIKNAIMMQGVAFDIGARVVKWNEKGGFDGYTTKRVVVHKVNRKTGAEKTKVIKGPRYSKRSIKKISQFFLHHSGGDGSRPSSMYQTLYNYRNLSVHYANEDNGIAYQFNDAVDCTWHAGKHNKPSIGVENCLYPLVKSRPDYYSPARNKRTGNLPHKIRTERVHGCKIKVFCMPAKQQDTLARLAAGNWVALAYLTGEERFLQPPQLPKTSRGTVPKTVIKDPLEHVGMIGHFHATRKKIDPLGLNWEKFEDDVNEYYIEFIQNLPNVSEISFKTPHVV
jgi:hypothetical protein